MPRLPLRAALAALLAAAACAAPPFPRLAPPPAPTTAGGFAAMFAGLPADEWGAADVSLSVLMPDGRSVWLFGDTLRGRGFVHSSAVTQDGGTLHVSRRGAQLLPDDSPTRIYWVEAATAAGPGRLRVVAEPVELTGTGPWDFRRAAAADRVAVAAVDRAGDVTFLRWTGWQRPPPPAADFAVVGPHHVTYGRRAHPQFRLASGRLLVTRCQNFDDPLAAHVDAGGRVRYGDYRPIFAAERRQPAPVLAGPL